MKPTNPSNHEPRERERERERESKGFTLLELLVVIAILAVLAAVTAVVINPAELMARARDTERATELNSIHRNLGLFLATAPSPSLGLANRVYISLPDTSATCASWTGLPPLPAGWSYVCSTPANFRRTDGTGWIPVNFDASAGGSPFAFCRLIL